MKIAIAAERKNIESEPVQEQEEHHTTLFFEKDKLVKTIKNPFAVGGGRAGHGVIQMLSNENVEIIISGKFGDNMQEALKEKNMKQKSILNTTVKEALEQLMKND